LKLFTGWWLLHWFKTPQRNFCVLLPFVNLSKIHKHAIQASWTSQMPKVWQVRLRSWRDARCRSQVAQDLLQVWSLPQEAGQHQRHWTRRWIILQAVLWTQIRTQGIWFRRWCRLLEHGQGRTPWKHWDRLQQATRPQLQLNLLYLLLFRMGRNRCKITFIQNWFIFKTIWIYVNDQCIIHTVCVAIQFYCRGSLLWIWWFVSSRVTLVTHCWPIVALKTNTKHESSVDQND